MRGEQLFFVFCYAGLRSTQISFSFEQCLVFSSAQLSSAQLSSAQVFQKRCGAKALATKVRQLSLPSS